MGHKYLFILGRNPKLSIAELESFFRKNRWDFKQLGLVENGLLVGSSAKIEKGIVKSLGGVVSFGEVLVSGKSEEVFSGLDKIELHNAKKNKLNYVVHNFGSENFVEVEEYLRKRFRGEKLKATEKKLTGEIKMQSGKKMEKVSSKLIDEEYFIFSSEKNGGEEFFGKILEKSDYDEIEKRDMEKPARRNELAISPRLAKILINLSEVNSDNGLLLDPFCGIGVVLEEALLQGIKVVGVDKDKTAIENAKKNLEWFKFDKKNYELINADSTGVRLKQGSKVSGIATEPDLGNLQKKNPSEEEAKKTLESFEKLMIRVLNNLKKYLIPEARIAFTAPLILIKNKKRLECDFEKISKSAGLKILAGPIEEFREGQIVGRSIVVMGR